MTRVLLVMQILASCETVSTTTVQPLTPSSDGSYPSPETIPPESPLSSADEGCHTSGGSPTAAFSPSSVYNGQTGMVDGSRIILCMFMFSILIFNPVRLDMLSSRYYRTLLYFLHCGIVCWICEIIFYTLTVSD